MKGFAAAFVALLVLSGCASSIRDGQEAFDEGDFESAHAFWLPLAENGDARAQFGMGQLNEAEAANDPAFLVPAAEWYLKAADQGHPDAMCRVGVVLDELGERESSDLWIGYAAACGQPDAINHAVVSGIDVPTVDRNRLPRECPHSTIHLIGGEQGDQPPRQQTGERGQR